jgi:hypothetical protein
MQRILFTTLLLAAFSFALQAQKILKAELIFTGLQNKENTWELCFKDRKKKSYCFNAQRSYTEPYIFYSTSTDGSLKENEKVKGSWFLVSYTILQNTKSPEKILTQVKLITESK